MGKPCMLYGSFLKEAADLIMIQSTQPGRITGADRTVAGRAAPFWYGAARLRLQEP